ncbi:hypothetical protein Aduo_010006 [Ancylostoma duodenale]
MSKWPDIVGGTKVLNDGAEIPMIGLGSNKIVDQALLNDFIQSALEIGYRLFDTAEQYVNEKELGCALKTVLPKVKLKREDIFITTKVRIEDGNAANWAEQSVMNSMRRFNTTYLDLVLIHYPRDRKAGSDDAYETNKKSRKEAWKKLEQLKEQGLIKSIGVSNFEVYHLVELLEYAKYFPAVNQIEIHPYLTRRTLVKFCEIKGIFVQAFSSLARGNQEILKEAAVQEPANRFGVSPQTILYAYGVCSGIGIIPNSANAEMLHNNLIKVAGISLTKKELASFRELDRNTALCPRCYPWRCL